MSRAAVTLAYLDWLLRACAVGFGVWIAVGSLSRFDQMLQARQVSVAVSPSPAVVVAPSPSPVVEPSPVEVQARTLSPLAEKIRGWDAETINRWNEFCKATQNGQGYGIQEQGICNALSEVTG